MSRRSIKDKQKENKYLRTLMLSILKKSDIRLLSLGPLSEELLASFYEAHQLDSFSARRRLERHIVNLMREADAEVLDFLQLRLDDPAQLESQRQAQVDSLRQRLFSDAGALSELIEEHPTIPVQKLRQLLRSAHKPQKSHALDSLLQEILGF